MTVKIKYILLSFLNVFLIFNFYFTQKLALF